MDHIHNPKVWTILIQIKLKKKKNKENLTSTEKQPKRYAPKKIRSTPSRPKTVLFKTNKTKNITIKSSSDRSRGDDGHWPALAYGGADRGNGLYSTLKGRQK